MCIRDSLEIFIKSLKLTWLRRMLISESKWTRLFTITTGCNVTHMCQFGFDYISRKMKVTSNPFWKETLSYIFELISICGLSQDNIFLEPLWYNNKIKVKKRVFFYKSLYNKGFHTVSDLINSQGIFITYESLTNDFL